jgi:hypothetical protein
MGWAYLVLVVIAGLGLALGWRLTPAPSHTAASGIARLLQLGIAFIGLSVLALLLVPWIDGLTHVSCTPEAEREGKCILGLHERGLFGVSAFVCLVGAAFAFVLRKGVFDFSKSGPIAESEREGGVGDSDTKVEARKRPAVDGSGTQDAGSVKGRGGAPADEAPLDGPPGEGASRDRAPREAGPQDTAPQDTAPQDTTSQDARPQDTAPADPPEPDEPVAGDEPEQAADRPLGHRHLQGPVFRAFVDDSTVELDVAITTAAQRLRSDRVAVVFSRGASEEANLALLELAEALGASRYVLEGTAAAAEGIPKGDKPDPHAADEIAGPDARHAGELALNLAGSFIQTVFLLDTRVLFPVFVLGKLTELQSVCIAHAHDEVSAVCQIVLPGTNLGEREGELVDSEGGTNSRRTREALVRQIIEALRALPPTPAADATVADDSATES